MRVKVSTPRSRRRESARKREKARGSRARARETLSCSSSLLEEEEEEEEEERTQNTIGKIQNPIFSQRVSNGFQNASHLLKLCAFGSSFARAIDAALFFSASSFSAGLLLLKKKTSSSSVVTSKPTPPKVSFFANSFVPCVSTIFITKRLSLNCFDILKYRPY